jgi:hypothetical protein
MRYCLSLDRRTFFSACTRMGFASTLLSGERESLLYVLAQHRAQFDEVWALNALDPMSPVRTGAALAIANEDLPKDLTELSGVAQKQCRRSGRLPKPTTLDAITIGNAAAFDNLTLGGRQDDAGPNAAHSRPFQPDRSRFAVRLRCAVAHARKTPILQAPSEACHRPTRFVEK